jgi:cellulose binding protein with CBM2 domain/fibronectin type III domain protein
MTAAAAGAVVLTTAIGVTGAQAVPAATPTPGPTSPSSDSYPPSPPTNLTLVRATSTSVTLSWTAPSSAGCCGLAGYEIAYRPTFWDQYTERGQSVGPDTTTVTITALNPTWVYDFWVSAVGQPGYPNASAGVKITVVTPASDSGDTTPPPAPTNVGVTSADATTVGLTWTPPADTSDIVAYDVYAYAGLSIGVTSLLGTTDGTTFQAPVRSDYFGYVVRSRDAAGNLSLYAGPALRPVSSSSPSTPVSSVPVTRSASPPSCRLAYTTSEWSHGFVSTIVITNTGPTMLLGWTMTYTFGGDQQITNSWGGTATQSGATVTFRNADWNEFLEPGASTYLGVQGTWNTSDAAPTTFAVNGSACTRG